MRKINYSNIKNKLINFLQDYLSKSGANGFLLGVSGGLDSAVVATLCKHAAPNSTYALLMPTSTSSRANLDDAYALCKTLEINHKVINLDNILNAYKTTLDIKNHHRLGNIMARIRMSLLYDASFNINALVVGTSNKSELMLGYGTIYGDLAYALNPIGELYKSEIFEFAKFLQIDEKIINKAPSADLFEGQSDEADLGYSYAVLDKVLEFIEVNGDNYENLIKNFNDELLINTVLKRVNSSEFKRRMPIIAKIS